MCTASRHLCKHRYIRPCVCVCSVTKLCLTPLNPMDCSPLGSSMHGISQAKILEWVVISFSRGSSRLRDQTQVSCIAGRFFTFWATGEAFKNVSRWCQMLPGGRGGDELTEVRGLNWGWKGPISFLHISFSLGMVLVTTSCTMSWTSIHSSSGTVCQI